MFANETAGETADSVDAEATKLARASVQGRVFESSQRHERSSTESALSVTSS
jgi:hypothetical protein